MLRFANAFWLACSVGLLLTACTNAKNYDAKSGRTHTPNFDKHYGHPSTYKQARTRKSSNHPGDFRSPSAQRIQLKSGAPQRYTVRKGDTLWSIAGKYLKKPWQWPLLHNRNNNIKNPHLIYPGDVIHLDRGLINTTQHHANSRQNHTNQTQGGRRIQPSIRIERSGNSMQGQPLSTLAAFVMRPTVMSKAEIKASPYLLASRDDRMLITSGDKVYLKGMRYSTEGQRCAVYRPSKALKDPATGRILGYKVNYTGMARIEKFVDGLAHAEIVDSQREIHSGDRLLEPKTSMVQLNAPISTPRHKVRGDVIELMDASAISGSRMVAVINKGTRDGIRPGHTLGVYDQGKKVMDPHVKGQNGRGYGTAHLPPKKVSDMVIFRTDEHISYGLLMHSTREVSKGYKIGNP